MLSREPAEIVRRHPQISALPVTIIPEAEEIFRKYAVDPVPHLVFLNRNGEVVQEVVGLDLPRLRELEARIQKEVRFPSASARESDLASSLRSHP